MTDAIANPYVASEINDDETSTRRLERKASDILAKAEDQAFAATGSIRQAVRDDLVQVRQLARDKAEATRDGIIERPIKSALYAAGVGVLIGLLLRR